jgi:hypothetical protein
MGTRNFTTLQSNPRQSSAAILRFGFPTLTGTLLHLLRIPCHIDDGQMREALAEGLGPSQAIGSWQANVDQQGTRRDPGLQPLELRHK